MKKIRLLSLLFFTLTPLYSSWSIEDLIPLYEQVESVPENDASFVELKNRVKKDLKESWCSDDKINLLMDLTYITHPQVCVEIGAFTGSSILPVASTLQYLGQGKIYAIDAWSNEVTTRYLEPNDPNRAWWDSVNMKDVRHSFDSMLRKWSLEDTCITIPKTSSLALNELPEIDFLHIDGDFSEQGSLYDTTHYLEKVKSGGYILLSNVYHCVNNKLPKLKAYSLLFDFCEFVSEADQENAVLFRKL